MKPAHVIVRLHPDGSLVRDAHGQLLYALVDYELLERTPEHELEVRTAHRQLYLKHMARRFEVPSSKPLPPHLKIATALGVDYIFGHAESTGGLLWVVGKDPDLFNYFLPERWRRTPKEPFSNQVFKTRTKDNVNLVWRVSRLGDSPNNGRHELTDQGYNSPFEEFAYALELSRCGVRTIYPRAIYVTGLKAGAPHQIADARRYRALNGLKTPDGEPALSEAHEYITIWGYWNGPDEQLAWQDRPVYRGVDAEAACQQGLIDKVLLDELLQRVQRRIERAGFTDLNLKPDHVLLSFNSEGQMALDTFGKPELRLCNFEFIRRLAPLLP